MENFAVASQSMTYSAYDSTERIAPNSDFDDEQIRKMLAQSITYSADSAESIAPDSDFDDETIRKMQGSSLYIRDREESERQKSSSLL